MKPKTDRALKLLESFNAVVPDVIEEMMREAGMPRGGTGGVAAGIRAQVNGYLAAVGEGGRPLRPRQLETVRVLMIVLVAAAKERQCGPSPYPALN
jgi:hypothetical protein